MQLSILELHQRDIFDISQVERKPAPGGVLDRKLVNIYLFGLY